MRSPLLAALLTAALSLPASAAIIPVDSGTDDGAGCTLREAVEAANTDAAVGGCPAGSGTDDIRLDVPLVTLTQGQIEIDSFINFAPATGRAGVEGAFDARLFQVNSGRTRFFRVDLIGGGEDGTGAADGGALRLETGARVVFISGRIRGHSAPSSGGAVWVGQFARFEAEDSVILRNVAYGDAATEGGGAIYTDGGTVELTRTLLRGNRAVGTSASGGGILGTRAALILRGGDVVRNRASRAGGGIELVDGSLILDDVDLIQNRAVAAPGNGGGVHVAGEATVTAMMGSMDSNVAAGEGGGLWIGPDVTATIDFWDLVNNRAQGDAADQGGGGIYVDGGDLTITDVGFVGNIAAGTDGSGGGIFLNDGTAMIHDGSLFLENKAERAGGAIEVAAATGASLTITGSDMQGNRANGAPGNGAGIHTSAGPVTLALTGGQFDSNVARGAGGALWLGDGTTALVDDVTFSVNRALGTGPAGGGAIYSTGADLTVTLASFNGNRSVAAGGALHQADGTLTLTGTLLDRNVAPSGGAVDVAGGTATIGNVQMTRNVADVRGGALAVGASANVDVTLASIAANRAEIGGGIAAEGLLSVRDTEVRRNEAADGGGIHMTGGRIVFAASLADANTARSNGGGIFADGGTIVVVNNATLYGNTADRGGALYAGTVDAAFDSGTVAENTAGVTGGGLWHSGLAADFTLANTIVADNTDSSPMPGEDPNLFGAFDGVGNSLIGTTPSVATYDPHPADVIGQDPQLEPLDDNGGPTETAALMVSSPAVDAGSTPLALDQRGFTRPAGTAVDIGAFEYGATDPDDVLAPPTANLSPAAPALTVAPNPMSSSATVRFGVDAAQTVTATLFDATGRRVRDVFEGRVEPGAPVAATVDVAGLASGVYVVVVQGETVRLTQSVTVVR